MEIGFLGWLFLAVAVGVYAKNHRGRSGLGWFVLALIISPLVAFILVLVMKDRRF